MIAGIGGPPFLKAMEELLGQPITADCGDRVGLAMEALRLGLRRVVVRPAVGGETGAMVLKRLQDIARQQGALVLGDHSGPIHIVDEHGRQFRALKAHEIP